MPKIGPSKGGSSGGRTEATLVSPGIYVIAIAAFIRKQGRDNGTEFLSIKWEVCGGRGAGKAFWATQMLNVAKEGTRKRWEVLCEACGVQEEFELGSYDEGTASEGDRNIARLLKGRAIVAEVAQEKDREYTNNVIKSVHFRSRWTEEQKEIIAEWNAKLADRGNPEDALGEPADYDGPPDSAPF